MNVISENLENEFRLCEQRIKEDQSEMDKIMLHTERLQGAVIRDFAERQEKLRSERDELKCCGNCRKGKPTSIDNLRCYGRGTPYLPVDRFDRACDKWECGIVEENGEVLEV